MRSFVRLFLPSFIHSSICSFIRRFVPSFLPSSISVCGPSFLRRLVCACLPSSMRACVRSVLRQFVPSFLRRLAPSFVDSFPPSFLRRFLACFLTSPIPSFVPVHLLVLVRPASFLRSSPFNVFVPRCELLCFGYRWQCGWFCSMQVWWTLGDCAVCDSASQNNE